MHLEIITVERSLYSGNVKSVTVPGAKGSFTILKNHAPIISNLTKGIIKFKTNDDEEKSMNVHTGFVKQVANTITICINP